MKKGAKKGNTYGSRNKGKSHAPIFNQIKERPITPEKIEPKTLRALAAQMILNAVEAIVAKKIDDKEGTNWKRDVLWLHNDDSNYHMCCDILKLDPEILKSMYPKMLMYE